MEGLRGLAALLVLIAHINGHAIGYRISFDWQETLAERYLDHIGGFGVCAFFCISGYLIFQSLVQRGDLRSFARSRALRIYPLFLVLTAAWFPYSVLNKPEFAAVRGDWLLVTVHFVSNVLFLPGIFNLPIAQNLAWSLSFEAAFYVTAGVMFLGWRANSAPKRALSRAVAVLAIAVLLIWRPYTWYFALGVLIYLWRKRQPDPPTWLKAGPTGPVAIVIAYIFMPEGWRTVPPSPYQFRSDVTTPITDQIRWQYFWESLHQWPIALAAATIFFAATAFEVGWLSLLLRLRWMRFLGQISYSLYLTHGIVLKPMVRLVKPLPAGLESGVYFVLCLCGAIALAWGSYVLIEQKLTRAISNRFPPPQPRGA